MQFKHNYESILIDQSFDELSGIPSRTDQQKPGLFPVKSSSKGSADVYFADPSYADMLTAPSFENSSVLGKRSRLHESRLPDFLQPATLQKQGEFTEEASLWA